MNWGIPHKILLIVLLFATSAYAQQALETGKVTKLMVHNDPITSEFSQRIRVHLSGDITNAFCPDGNWVINLNNEAAKTQYSMLLSAYMADREVTITGNPSENCIANMELVRNVELN